MIMGIPLLVRQHLYTCIEKAAPLFSWSWPFSNDLRQYMKWSFFLIDPIVWPLSMFIFLWWEHCHGFMQKRRNSSALAVELCLFCIKPSISIYMALGFISELIFLMETFVMSHMRRLKNQHESIIGMTLESTWTHRWSWEFYHEVWYGSYLDHAIEKHVVGITDSCGVG